MHAQVLKELRSEHDWDDVLQSSQGTTLAAECLQALQAAIKADPDVGDNALVELLGRVRYVTAEPVQVNMKGSTTRFFINEEMADGIFFKLNSNRHDGGGFRDEKTKEPLAILGQALTCFSYCSFTQCEALLCDVQGKGEIFFDPAWVTVTTPEGKVPFGLGNVGNLTIKRFFELHDHDNNPICQKLQTVPPAPQSFIFANLSIIVDIKSNDLKRHARQTITSFGGTAMNVPIKAKKVCVDLSCHLLMCCCDQAT